MMVLNNRFIQPESTGSQKISSIFNDDRYKYKQNILLVIILLGLFGILIMLRPAWSGMNELLYSFDDDAFYYFKIAENIANGSGSTFNRVYFTNGYHPLWMGILVSLQLFAKISGLNFLILVKFVTILFYLITLAIGYNYIKNNGNGLHGVAMAVLLAMFYILIAQGGMEIVLTIPLLLFFLFEYLYKKRFFWLCLLAAGLFLSRIDSVILIVLPLLFTSINVFKKDKKRLIFLSMPVFVIGAYVVLNLIYFKIPFPISGLAKTSSEFSLFETPMWKSVFVEYTNWKKINLMALLSFLVMFVYMLLPKAHHFKNSPLPLLFGVCLYFLVTAARSDWPMWPWYFYSVCIIFILAYLVFLDSQKMCQIKSNFSLITRKVLGRTLSLLIIFESFYLGLAVIRTIFIPYPTQPTSIEVVNYMNSHPGRYAMGDRAGLIGYLSRAPIIQLEGLVMDAQYLQILKRTSMTLTNIFETYHVDYYITCASKEENGYYSVKEPIFGGRYTRKAHGSFNYQPVIAFNDGCKIFHT